MPTNLTTTSGKAIQQPSRDLITLYAPDGSSFQCAPVDARESLASGYGYSLTPPESANEQPSEQQSVNGDAPEVSAKAQSEGETFTGDAQVVETGESVVAAAFSKITKGRKAKS